MDVELVVDPDPSGDETRSLRRWLLDVPEFRGRVSLRASAPRPGEMGRRIEAVVLALGGAAERSAEALDATLAAWLSSRRRTVTGAAVTLHLRVIPGEVSASVSAELPHGELDASLRAFVDELAALTERVGSGRTAAIAERTGDVPDVAADAHLGLSDAEVRELARIYDSRARVDVLLRKAGLGPESFAVFEGAPNAEVYWAEVGRELAFGKSPGGRRRLLAVAAVDYPGNPVFRGGGEEPAGC